MTDNSRAGYLLKPNYLKKQSSLSSFLQPKGIIQVQTGLEYSAGKFHAFKWPCARNTGRSGSGKNQKS